MSAAGDVTAVPWARTPRAPSSASTSRDLDSSFAARLSFSQANASTLRSRTAVSSHA